MDISYQTFSIAEISQNNVCQMSVKY